MFLARVIGALLFACVCAMGTLAQQTTPVRAASSATNPESSLGAPSLRSPNTRQVPATIRLNIPRGTPLQVALDREVRVRKAGQPIHGRIVEPVYAFDKLVIPVGTEALGKIAKIDPVSGTTRTLAALDADFTPAHRIHLEFTEIVLSDGKHIPIETRVTPGSGQVIQFITAADRRAQKKGVKNAAAEKTRQAKQQAKQEWHSALAQVRAPGKLRRFAHYALAQLPVHPQYISAGTVYFAELQQSLNFGSETIAPELAESIGTLPPDGAAVHARLITPLSSAIARKGDEVDAIVSQPLFNHDRLIIPQGSHLKGTVLQVKRARSLARSGQLRIVFREFSFPDQVEQKVEANLVGIQAARARNVKLDSEGGAKATPPNTRLLATTAEVGLGAVSFLGDTFGDVGPRTAGGAGGFKLIGIIIGVSVRSQALGMAMGAYGGARSIYTNFIAKGHELVFPKNTAMEIGIMTRRPPTSAAPTKALPGGRENPR